MRGDPSILSAKKKGGGKDPDTGTEEIDKSGVIKKKKKRTSSLDRGHQWGKQGTQKDQGTP